MRYPAATFVLLASTLFTRLGSADVGRVVIERREPVDGGRAFGAAGAYERISGKIYFSFDPKSPADRAIGSRDGGGAKGI